MPIGLTLPFAKNSGSLGYLAFSSSEIQAATYNLKSLVLTNWGERPNNFYLGCNLREFLFSQPSDQLVSQIKDRIESQVAKWLPYIRLNEVEVSFPTDTPNGARVKISFGLSARPDKNSVLVQDIRV